MRRGLLLLVLPVVLGAAERSAPPWTRNQQRLGQDLYREHCVVCHDIDKSEKNKKPGPSFYHLFQNGKLPITGAKPSREYIAVKVKFGGQIMPPFIKKMTDAEIAALVSYMETK